MIRTQTLLAALLATPAVLLVGAAPAQAARPTHTEYSVIYIAPDPAGSVTRTCAVGKVIGGTATILQPGIGTITNTTVVKGTGRNAGSVTASYSTTAEGNIEFAITCTGIA